MSKMCLSPEDIIKQGGIRFILEQEKITNIQIQELDYSHLFKSEGEEVDNIWPFLFQDTIEKQDPEKMLEAAEHFEQISENLSPLLVFEGHG